MIDAMIFLADDGGVVRTDRLVLGVAALLILGIAGYQLFEADIGSLFSIVDPGVAAFTTELEVASSKLAAD